MTTFYQDYALLDERLSNLERVLANNMFQDAKTKLDGDISTSVVDLNKQFTTVLSKNKEIQNLFDKHQQASAILDNNQATLPAEVKAEIVVAMQTTLKDTAQLVSKLNELKKYINTEHIQNIKQVGAKVESIGSAHIDQKLMANQMEERYNNLIFAYDETITALSQKFLYWDYMLSKWEQTVDELLAKK
eukprot:TRINITY_DN6555_c0_g1_i1.p1 TRINITY_DN6555_c0_g1~~TRINITY_DN6555_c0_g1_i1.p1  ORF type:complete len:197 (-),score=34.46 TRINITY_DN6555_c0_g1_i1:28-594(-)